jgi:hypothetical protein
MKARWIVIALALIAALAATAEAQTPTIQVSVTSTKSAGAATSRSLAVARGEAYHYRHNILGLTPSMSCESKTYIGKDENDRSAHPQVSGVTAAMEYDSKPGDTDYPPAGMVTIIDVKCVDIATGRVLSTSTATIKGQ